MEFDTETDVVSDNWVIEIVARPPAPSLPYRTALVFSPFSR